MMIVEQQSSLWYIAFMTTSFADRLTESIHQTSPIVVGIDPNFNLMPHCLVPDSVSDIESKLLLFSTRVLDACQGLVSGVKFQAAYYEAFGLAGLQALAKAVLYAKQLNYVVIMDAKRGDIGSTSTAYAQAFLAPSQLVNETVNVPSDFESDALTINPYLGDDSLDPFLKLANEHQKGVFILVKTSNPGSVRIQDQLVSNQPLSHHVATWVNEYSLASMGSQWSNIGCVVGATHMKDAAVFRELMPKTLFLVPGVGAQGGQVSDVMDTVSVDGGGVVIPISRGITYGDDRSVSLDEFQTNVRERALSFQP